MCGSTAFMHRLAAIHAKVKARVVVVAGPDVAVLLGSGVGVLVEDLGVAGDVLGKLGDDGRLPREAEPLLADGFPGGVEGPSLK